MYLPLNLQQQWCALLPGLPSDAFSSFNLMNFFCVQSQQSKSANVCLFALPPWIKKLWPIPIDALLDLAGISSIGYLWWPFVVILIESTSPIYAFAAFL